MRKDAANAVAAPAGDMYEQTGPLRARMERIAEDARVANDKLQSEIQIVRGDLKASEEQMRLFRGQAEVADCRDPLH